jgi:hypothetical protein
MIGIAAVAVVLWLAIYQTGIFVGLLFVGINVYTFLETRPSGHRKTPRRPPEPSRFSIWQLLTATAIAVALYLALVRRP